jgi:glycosyltransferase involved in cell wall biosynthesis
MTRLFVDVEDLFIYARNTPRPSGIQRMCFEIYSALQQRYGAAGQVLFVRQAAGPQGFRTVPWDAVLATYEGLSRPVPPAAPPPEPPPPPLRHRFARHVSPGLRLALGLFRRDLIGTVRHGLRVLLELARLLRPRAPAIDDIAWTGGEDVASLAQPGDVLVVLGSPWSQTGYAARLAPMRARHGMRFALLVHDIIPVRRPEWCDAGLVRDFMAWFDAMLPLCDHIFANSRYTAGDVERFAEERHLAIPRPVTALPIGTSFTAFGPPAGTLRAGLPAAGGYVLFVSTIEARKNHMLMLRVWRRLLETMPPEQVPVLIFAGRVGWLVADLMRQLANCRYLDGHIRIVEDPSDVELIALYKGCLFTVFPSLFEGWGLPVSESLAMGKPCVVARATSLPESAGPLARYFDPENTADATAAIRAVLEDRPALAAWTAQVQAEFRPVPWDDTARTLMEALA